MEITRRNFIKSTAVAMAMAAATGTLASCAPKVNEPLDGETVKKTLAVCRFCGCGCGVIVESMRGKVISVYGDPENDSNRGLNCIKGYYLSKILYGADRLTKPLIRDDNSKKGTSDGFREATWNEALDLVADHLRRAGSRFGGAASSPSWKATPPRSSGRRACSRTTSTRTRACAWPAPSWAS